MNLYHHQGKGRSLKSEVYVLAKNWESAAALIEAALKKDGLDEELNIKFLGKANEERVIYYYGGNY